MRLYSILVLIAAAATDALPLAGYKTTYEVVKTGTGSEVVSKGATVTVHATGIVAETSKKFWSTKDAGQQSFTYQAGVGGVITGARPQPTPRLPRTLKACRRAQAGIRAASA